MFDRITRTPEVLNGQPCIRNLRISVKRVLEILAVYDEREELFSEYPELEEKDLKQALEDDRIVITLDTDFHTILTVDWVTFFCYL